jgi:hypothetical protein
LVVTTGRAAESVVEPVETSVVEKYLHVPEEIRQSFITRFKDALYDGDVASIMAVLTPFFASIPYDLIVEKENYYQTAVHLIVRY